MAVGLPVVASRATAHPWVLGDAGLLAEPDNAIDLANQISRVLTDDMFYGELVQRGLARARSFRWNDTKQAGEKLSQSLRNGCLNSRFRGYAGWLPRQPRLRLRRQRHRPTN